MGHIHPQSLLLYQSHLSVVPLIWGKFFGSSQFCSRKLTLELMRESSGWRKGVGVKLQKVMSPQQSAQTFQERGLVIDSFCQEHCRGLWGSIEPNIMDPPINPLTSGTYKPAGESFFLMTFCSSCRGFHKWVCSGWGIRERQWRASDGQRLR